MSALIKQTWFFIMLIIFLFLMQRASSTLKEDKAGCTKSQLLAETVEPILEGGEGRCSLLQYQMGDHFTVIHNFYLSLSFTAF